MQLPVIRKGSIAWEDVEYGGKRAMRRKFTTEELIHMGEPATVKILTGLKLNHGRIVSVNYQPAGTYQGFHTDPGVEAPAVVVHASDDGTFDYHETAKDAKEAMTGYESLDVGAGDIVAQFKPEKYHRGGNPSERDRYNMVVFRMMPVSVQYSIPLPV